jgi:integrase/recombinase XerD
VFLLLLDDLLEEFLYECEIKNYTKGTIKSYKNNNNLFLNFIESECEITEIENLKPAHIKRYIKFAAQKGLKLTHVNSILKTLRAFMKYYVDEEYIDENPFLKVNWQK